MAITLLYTQPEVKEVYNEEGDLVSSEVLQIQDGFAIAAIKDTIYLKYDKLGNCQVLVKDAQGIFTPSTDSVINLGNKNEHRVT
jgi:hypothetical protein